MSKEYGYWLKPNGELIPVDYQNHKNVAIRFGFYEEPVVSAINSGIIRIIKTDKELCCSIVLITREQGNIIMDMAEDFFKDNKRIFIDVNGKIYIPKSSFDLGRILLEATLVKS